MTWNSNLIRIFTRTTGLVIRKQIPIPIFGILEMINGSPLPSNYEVLNRSNEELDKKMKALKIIQIYEDLNIVSNIEEKIINFIKNLIEKNELDKPFKPFLLIMIEEILENLENLENLEKKIDIEEIINDIITIDDFFSLSDNILELEILRIFSFLIKENYNIEEILEEIKKKYKVLIETKNWDLDFLKKIKEEVKELNKKNVLEAIKKREDNKKNEEINKLINECFKLIKKYQKDYQEISLNDQEILHNCRKCEEWCKWCISESNHERRYIFIEKR